MSADEEDDEDGGEYEDEDAGTGAAPARPASEPHDDAGATWAPTNVGLSVGIHGPGYGIPFGNANGSSIRDYVVSGMVPIGVDAGWFFSPHFYAGAYFTYGFGLGAGLLNDQCNGADDCSATVIQVGVVAHWHFLPEATLDPWVGLGLGYEEIVTAGTSTDTGDTDLSHGSPALLGSLEGGFDFKPLRYLGVGPYAQLMGGPFIVTDSGMHGWLTLGVRFRTNL